MSESTHVVPNRASTRLLLAAGAFAALILVLGVNGTLSAWSTAIINNTENSAAAAGAVALSEATGAGAVCADTVTDANNTATCATINKYGGTSTPLEPGGSQTATVIMANTGTASGNLSIAAGACSKSGGINTTDSLCDYLTVALECPTGTSVGTAATLTAWSSAGSTPVASLASGGSVTCTFTVTLASNAPTTVAGQTASQPLTWTLTAA